MIHENSYTDFLARVSSSLKNARRKCGYTQAQLGKITQRTQSTVAKLESNPAHDVPLRVLFEVASALSIPLWQLIREAEDNAQPVSEAEPSIVMKLKGLPGYKRMWVEQILDLVIASPLPKKAHSIQSFDN